MWSALEIGKHAGRSLPQILFSDYFSGRRKEDFPKSFSNRGPGAYCGRRVISKSPKPETQKIGVLNIFGFLRRRYTAHPMAKNLGSSARFFRRNFVPKFTFSTEPIMSCTTIGFRRSLSKRLNVFSEQAEIY